MPTDAAQIAVMVLRKVVVSNPTNHSVLSDLRAYTARPPPTMDIEGTRTASSTQSDLVSERAQARDVPSVPSHHALEPSSAATSTPSNLVPNPSNHTQAINSQHAPPMAETQSGSHAHFPTTNAHYPTDATLGAPEQQPPHHVPPPSPRLEPSHDSIPSLNGSAQTSPSRIKVRDLSHIQSFASEEVLTRSRHPSRLSLRGRIGAGQQYEISSMPVQDIIEMVAGLLTKITTTNDRQHEHLHRHIPESDGSTTLSQQAKSVLAFHGKNVPSITIASYLSRIHKYCPTTYEVFLSLLVYFDRMTEMVNSGSLSTFAETGQHNSRPGTAQSTSSSVASGGLSFGHPTSPTTQNFRSTQPQNPLTSSNPQDHGPSSTSISSTLSDADAYDISHSFVVDSFNIHRLVMAGVTCASKFFSDVFYTNSRYAKVNSSSVPSILPPQSKASNPPRPPL